MLKIAITMKFSLGFHGQSGKVGRQWGCHCGIAILHNSLFRSKWEKSHQRSSSARPRKRTGNKK